MKEFQCPFHEAHEAKIQRNISDIKALHIRLTSLSDKIDKIEDNFNKKIDGINSMLIKALALTLLQLIVLGLTVFFTYVKLKG